MTAVGPAVSGDGEWALMFDMSSGPSMQQATLRFDHHCTPTRCPRRPYLRSLARKGETMTTAAWRPTHTTKSTRCEQN